MSSDPIEFVRHMLLEADYLLASSAGVSREAFLQDETLKGTE